MTKRTAQLNVRLMHEEKAMIAAAEAGFKGLADFLRSTVPFLARTDLESAFIRVHLWLPILCVSGVLCG